MCFDRLISRTGHCLPTRVFLDSLQDHRNASLMTTVTHLFGFITVPYLSGTIRLPESRTGLPTHMEIFRGHPECNVSKAIRLSGNVVCIYSIFFLFFVYGLVFLYCTLRLFQFYFIPVSCSGVLFLTETFHMYSSRILQRLEILNLNAEVNWLFI